MIEPRNYRIQDAGDGGPDLTAMLDILFILLVFFLLTTGTVLQHLDLTLPEAGAKTLPSFEKPQITLLEIRKDGYVLEGQPVENLAVLQKRLPLLLTAKPDHHLHIAADDGAEAGKLLRLLSWLRGQGIETANILMKSETENQQ